VTSYRRISRRRLEEGGGSVLPALPARLPALPARLPALPARALA
jgi:hypothetical protein